MCSKGKERKGKERAGFTNRRTNRTGKRVPLPLLEVDIRVADTTVLQ